LYVMYQGTAGHEVEAVSDLSALVNYIEPIRFHSFEHANSMYCDRLISFLLNSVSMFISHFHLIEQVSCNANCCSSLIELVIK